MMKLTSIPSRLFLLSFVFFLVVIFTGPARPQVNELENYSFAEEQFFKGSAKGDYTLVTSAIKKFQLVLQNNTQNFDVLLRLAQSYYIIGNFVLADEYLQRAKKIEQDSFDLKILSLELTIQLGRLEESKEIILELESLIPNNPYFLYAKLKYNAVVGDVHAVQLGLESLSVLLQENDFYTIIFSLIVALSENRFSVEDRNLLAQLQNFDISFNSWVEWIVGDYYFFSGERARAGEFYQQIIDKRLPQLIPNAYEKSISINRENEKFTTTIAIVKQYVEDFPTIESARLFLAELYMSNNDYESALESLEVARNLILDSEIISFAYDVALREYVQRSNKMEDVLASKVSFRIQELLDAATKKLRDGQEVQAEQLARRAYYIDIENIRVLSFLAELYRIQNRPTLSQGYFELLEKAVNSNSSDIAISEETMRGYLNRVESLKHVYQEYLSDIPLNPDQIINHEYTYSWSLVINVNVDFETSAYTTFVQKMLEFYIEQYPHLSLSPHSATSPTHPVLIEVNFRDFDGVFELNSIISNSNSNEILSESTNTGYGNLRFQEVLSNHAARIAAVLPRIANVLPKDSRSFYSFLGTDDGITQESKVMFVDKNPLSLISSAPYFVLSDDNSDIEARPIIIKDAISVFAIDENQAADSIQFLQKVGRDDFALFTTPYSITNIDETTQEEDIFADYIQRMRLPLWDTDSDLE